MLLAGDIGGTKTNLALYAPDSGLAAQAQATFKSANYGSLEAVVEEFLTTTGAEVDRAVFGVAGPVVDGQSATTNLPWVIREADVQQAFDLQEVKLLNDLEATAYGVPQLSPSDLFQLNDAQPRSGTKVVVAPGTGLGEAVLFYRDGHHHVIPSEGGHAGFAPTNLTDRAVQARLIAPVEVVLELNGAILVEGELKIRIGHLAGTRPVSDGRPSSVSLSWVVQAEADYPAVTITAIS